MIAKLRTHSIGGFTLVEIMIVVAIIALLAAIAVPSFIRARTRSQATMVIDEARMIADAIDEYAIENNKASSAGANWADITPYLKKGTALQNQAAALDSLGNSLWTDGTAVSVGVRVSATTKDAVSDATGGDTFWKAYS